MTPAPLFDNGTSLWCNQTADSIYTDRKAKSQPFLDTHDEQIKLVKDFSWLELKDLAGLDEEANELLLQMRHINAKRRDAICFGLRKRVSMFLEILI
jgi:hypothetical protein